MIIRGNTVSTPMRPSVRYITSLDTIYDSPSHLPSGDEKSVYVVRGANGEPATLYIYKRGQWVYLDRLLTDGTLYAVLDGGKRGIYHCTSDIDIKFEAIGSGAVANITSIDTIYDSVDSLPTDVDNGTTYLVINGTDKATYAFDSDTKAWTRRGVLRPHVAYVVLTGKKRGIYRYTMASPYLVSAEQKDVVNITSIDTVYDSVASLPTNVGNGTSYLVVNDTEKATYSFDAESNKWIRRYDLQSHVTYIVLSGKKSGIYRYTMSAPYLVSAEQKDVVNITSIDTIYNSVHTLPTDAGNGTSYLVINDEEKATYSFDADLGKWIKKYDLQAHVAYIVLTGEKSGVYRYTMASPYLVSAEEDALGKANAYTDAEIEKVKAEFAGGGGSGGGSSPITVDQSYNPFSTNPQSGKAVNAAMNNAIDDAAAYTDAEIEKAIAEHEDSVGRTLSFVKPEMYGAVGDGETDDTEAFESMLASAKTSILIPNKRYKITRKLWIPDNTYITGCGKESVILCHSTEDLFMVGGMTHITNLSVNVQARLSGAIFKINEETLADFIPKGSGSIGTHIDKIWVYVNTEVDRHTSCFEVSNKGFTTGNLSGFYDAHISRINVKSSPTYNLGYFFKGFSKGANSWITGICVSECTIAGARWAFFLRESDENIFDPAVNGTFSTLLVTKVQHQKQAENCKAFIYVPKDTNVILTDCIPWDWSQYGAEDTHCPYIVDRAWLYNRNTIGKFVVKGLYFENTIQSFASLDEQGNYDRFGYGDYALLNGMGIDIEPVGSKPKLMSLKPADINRPAAMLLYKHKVPSIAYRYIRFDIYTADICCNVTVKYDRDTQTMSVFYDKDLSYGWKLAYKVADNVLYLYLKLRGTPVDSFVRSIELTNTTSGYSEFAGFADYNHTINCWDYPESERYLAELPDDITEITDIHINSWAPRLVSPNGSMYQLHVDNYGNLTTGSPSATNSPTVVTSAGVRYKIVVDENGTLSTERVDDTLKKCSFSYARG